MAASGIRVPESNMNRASGNNARTSHTNVTRGLVPPEAVFYPKQFQLRAENQLREAASKANKVNLGKPTLLHLMHYHPPGLKMIRADHSLTFANLASVNFTLLEYTHPTAPDTKMIQDITGNNLEMKTGEQLMSWNKGCYFGKSGQDDVALCWQDMEALQSFCVGVESPERGFFKPIQSHYKTKYNDGTTNSAWTFPSDDPAVGYTYPSTLNYYITVSSIALKDQLHLNITIEDKSAAPRANEKK